MSAPGGGAGPLGTGPILTKEEAEAIAKKVLSFASSDAETIVNVQSSNSQNTRFARSEITTQLDNASGLVTVVSRIGGRTAIGRTQRFEDEGLADAVKWAEAAAREGPGRQQGARLVRPRTYEMSEHLWHDRTREVDIRPRIQEVVTAIDGTKGYVTAGTLNIGASSQLVANSIGLAAYCKSTQGGMNLTVRSMDNTGSGWAGNHFYDFENLGSAATTARAVDKAERSRDPRGLEPGRYTVILEPDAYAGMVGLMMQYHMDLESAERGTSVFTNPSGGTKIGLKVLDDRLSFVSDPLDPDGPFCPFNGSGVPFRRTYWIQDGILKNLSYNDATAEERGEEFPLANPVSVRLEPKAGTPLMTLDQMVETCDRGVYVTRLTTGFADFRHLVFTGVTRDGTWLIENGEISHPIQNFRYLDSHLFFLNNLEAVGKPVLTAGGGMVLPPVRSRDFNFTALADAV